MRQKIFTVSFLLVLSGIFSGCCSDDGEIEKINNAVSKGDIDKVLDIGNTSCSDDARLHVNKIMSEIMNNPEGAAGMSGAAVAKVLVFWAAKWREKKQYESWDKRAGLSGFLNDLCFYGEPSSKKRGVMCNASWDKDPAFQKSWLDFTDASGEDAPVADSGFKRLMSECVLCMNNPDFLVKADLKINAHENNEFPFVIVEKLVNSDFKGEILHDFYAALSLLPEKMLGQKVKLKGDPHYSDDKELVNTIKQYVVWGLVDNFQKGKTEKILSDFLKKITDETKGYQDFDPVSWANPVFFKDKKGFYKKEYREIIFDSIENKPCSWFYFALAANSGRFDKDAYNLSLQAINECKLPTQYYASLMRCRAGKKISARFLPPYDLDEMTGGFGIKQFSCLNKKWVRKKYYKAVYNKKLEKENRKKALKSLEKLCVGRNKRRDYCKKVKRLKLDYYFQY